jgi:hypothetical protein
MTRPRRTPRLVVGHEVRARPYAARFRGYGLQARGRPCRPCSRPAPSARRRRMRPRGPTGCRAQGLRQRARLFTTFSLQGLGFEQPHCSKWSRMTIGRSCFAIGVPAPEAEAVNGLVEPARRVVRDSRDPDGYRARNPPRRRTQTKTQSHLRNSAKATSVTRIAGRKFIIPIFRVFTWGRVMGPIRGVRR